MRRTRTILEKKSHVRKEHALGMMFPELAAWWPRGNGDEEDTVGNGSAPREQPINYYNNILHKLDFNNIMI